MRTIPVRWMPLVLVAACVHWDPPEPRDYGRFTPLECGRGTGESAVAQIGRDSGIVTVRGHSLALRPGAVNANAAFRITERDTTFIAVDVEPHGTRFGPDKAVLTLSYARCGGNPPDWDGLVIVEVRPGTAEVLRALPSAVDSIARTVTSTGLDHLSGYLIAGT